MTLIPNHKIWINVWNIIFLHSLEKSCKSRCKSAPIWIMAKNSGYSFPRRKISLGKVLSQSIKPKYYNFVTHYVYIHKLFSSMNNWFDFCVWLDHIWDLFSVNTKNMIPLTFCALLANKEKVVILTSQKHYSKMMIIEQLPSPSNSS